MQEKGQNCATMRFFCQIYTNKRANMHKHHLENKPSGLNAHHTIPGLLIYYWESFFDQKVKMHGIDLR